jgi:hypothetical protein
VTRVQHSPISGNDVTLVLQQSRGPLVKVAAGSEFWSTLLEFRHLREYLDSFLSASTALGLVLPDGGSVLHPSPTLRLGRSNTEANMLTANANVEVYSQLVTEQALLLSAGDTGEVSCTRFAAAQMSDYFPASLTLLEAFSFSSDAATRLAPHAIECSLRTVGLAVW